MKRFLVAMLLVVGCGEDTSDPRNVQDSGSQDSGTVVMDAGADSGADAQVDAADEGLPDQPWSVTEPGYYRVGYRSGFEVTYDAVGEPGRTFNFVAWYPTLDTEGAISRYYNLFNRPEVLKNASVALTEPAPILIFSHGNSSFAEQSYSMTEFFASHGCIVFALNHTGNTFKTLRGGSTSHQGRFGPKTSQR